ncbi:MAG TPA: hypothetical protein PKK59_01865 [Anaerolineaceae bacterium]|nr:hypothetical protein [Anaerolineaceae bacterium]
MEHGMEQPGVHSLWGLEERLSSLLEPVTPDPEFVESLKMKLSHTPAVLIETGRRKLGLLVVGIGLFAGALTLWLLRRRSD